MDTAKTIITIGREFGSGGSEIGSKLADAYGIKMYDKELLAEAAQESGICENLFESHDEKPTNSFLYSLVMDPYSMGYPVGSYSDMPINHRVFLAQFDAIKNIANREVCVIVGRCADYALEDYSNCAHIFIHADLEKRIRRVARMFDLTNAKAKEMIVKTDKKRSSYYNYFTNRKWGDAAGYDLCIDSGKLGIDGCVEAIQEYIKIKEHNPNPML